MYFLMDKLLGICMTSRDGLRYPGCTFLVLGRNGMVYADFRYTLTPAVIPWPGNG